VVAAGLENGEIQLWDVIGDPKKPKSTFFLNKDDRVLDLKFSQDGRYLFSGHGSGAILQWDVNQAIYNHGININYLVKRKPVSFSVYGLALVGEEGQHLAIGGRYNSLVLWNWKQNKLRSLQYKPLGGQEDYILSLNSAEFKPNLLATSDTQGQITLWNMQPCLTRDGECEVIEQWSDGHGGKAVRSVALSNDGCYLVSGGDDGQVKLWNLTTDGKRSSPEGKLVTYVRNSFDRFLVESHKYNSVDVKVVDKHILVVAGNQDRQVSFKKLDLDPSSECSR
jgi:WD40 repeat protein